MATRRLSGIATSSSVPDNGGDHSGGGGSAGGYVDDVFSIYLYTGTNANQTIVNGIDLAGEGGLIWSKSRTGPRSHGLIDTERGFVGQVNLETDSANAASDIPAGKDVTGFNSNGFSLGPAYTSSWNYSGDDFVSWTFRKAPSFFDVVTWTGDGVQGREIPHNLGVAPGMILIKATNQSDKWIVYHRGLDDPTKEYLTLNLNTASVVNASIWDATAPSDSVFTIGSSSYVNFIGSEYVAYVFAHDDSDAGMIQCGSYTGSGGAGNEIDLGWEPQWVLIKGSRYDTNWLMYDTMRGMTAQGINGDERLFPNLSKDYQKGDVLEPTPNGLNVYGGNGFGLNNPNEEYIYMAIRRPNKPAEEFEADELFAMFQSGNLGNLGGPPGFRSGFPVDMAFWTTPNGGGTYKYIGDRLNQGSHLYTHETDSAYTSGTVPDNFKFDYNNGYYSDGNASYFSWMWRRAHGFFDVVTYEGTGVAGLQVPHSLGVKPEMMWVKCKNAGGDWAVYSDSVALDGKLNQIDTFGFSFFNEPTDEVFTIKNGPDNDLNAGRTAFYIAYLFASVPGICDIGTYTGNGSAQDIDCGFTNGARFVLFKRTDNLGNWVYVDAVRGMSPSGPGLASNLALNSTDAELLANTATSQPSGFQLLSVSAGNAALSSWDGNIDGAEYIYMAIA